MAIKQDADRAFFTDHPEQRALAHALSEAFDITFAAPHGQLSYWLAQASTRARERFGLQKEVLVVYSGFPETDARVLTAIENISRAPEFRHRIDPVLTIVIHSGDHGATVDLARTSTDRVLVPFQVKELRAPSRPPFFIRARIAEAVGSIDLFGMSSPLTSDKYFFGRTDLVQQLMRRSWNQKQNSGLFGLRKTGKTSVLYAIARALENQPVLFDYFDCQNPGIHNARWWQVLANVARRFYVLASKRAPGKFERPANYTEASAGTQFIADLRSYLDVGGFEQVVLMFDEIEFITQGIAGRLGQHWDDDFLPFWQSVRAAHQELQGRLTFIVAGVNPTAIQKSHFGNYPNPIFQLAQPYYLQPLSTDDVYKMLRTIGRYAGLSFDNGVCEVVQRTFGGHPFLIRLACSEIWRANKPTDPDKNVAIGADVFATMRPQIRARLSQPIRDILLSLVWWYPDEYSLLQILADGDSIFVQEYLKNNPDTAVQFAQYGLLRLDTSEFAIDDVRDFLRDFGEAYKRELSPFARSDMPPALLPEVPDLELLGRLFEKRCELEIKLRRIIYMYLGVKCGWDTVKVAQAMLRGIGKRQDRPDPAALFTKRDPKQVVNELFTLDLKAIVSQNWSVFAHLFDDNRPRFEMNMDTINRARRVDAHTHPVTNEEASEFENSYQWLLGRLNRVPDVGP